MWASAPTNEYAGACEFAEDFCRTAASSRAEQSLVERRLDNVVYRLGYASTRREARQLVNHGHYTVNGKRVNIPSYTVNVGDVIAVCENSCSTRLSHCPQETILTSRLQKI